MKHLTGNELVDLLDDALPPMRAAHLETCAQCRDAAAGLRSVLRDAADVDVPHPSPLFWDHFAARVSGAIENHHVAPPPPAWVSWWRRPVVAWGTAASFALVLMVAALWRATLMPAPGSLAQPDAAVAEAAIDAEPDNLEDDAAWAVVRTAADEMEWDDAHEMGIAARPGSAERAVLDLSTEERAELARLLAFELKRSGD
jgi:hypothetical protein